LPCSALHHAPQPTSHGTVYISSLP
jgi:hypothetical protein